jgi:hypothetical protein
MASAHADAIFVAVTDPYVGLAQFREWFAEYVVGHVVLEDVKLLEDGLVVEEATELGATLPVQIVGARDGFSSLAVRSPPLGVTVSFLSAAAADELDRLVNWRKSLGQQLESQ